MAQDGRALDGTGQSELPTAAHDSRRAPSSLARQDRRAQGRLRAHAIASLAREQADVAAVRLAGWDTSQPIVEVNLRDNTERTLPEDETVTLKPGHGFAKKVKFQRG